MKKIIIMICLWALMSLKVSHASDFALGLCLNGINLNHSFTKHLKIVANLSYYYNRYSKDKYKINENYLYGGLKINWFCPTYKSCSIGFSSGVSFFGFIEDIDVKTYGGRGYSQNIQDIGTEYRLDLLTITPEIEINDVFSFYLSGTVIALKSYEITFLTFSLFDDYLPMYRPEIGIKIYLNRWINNKNNK